MTEWLLALVPQYGVWLLGTSTFIACLAIPVPSSMLMLAAGGFVAAGDLSLVGTAGAALSGAFVGDQVVYGIGKSGGEKLVARLGSKAKLLEKATAMLKKRGGFAIFLSRWLLSALGPYMNFAAGTAQVPWLIFTMWGLAGEIVWVSLYLGLGYYFTGNLAAASSMAINILGFVGAGAIAAGLGYWIYANHKTTTLTE